MPTKTFLRIAGMAGAAALVAGWLTAATGTRQISEDPGPVSSPRPAATTPSLMALNLAAEVDRLHERVTHAPVPRETMRNPFELPHTTSRPVPSVPAASPEAPAPVTAPAPPPRAVTLVGIAAHETADGLERTVIVSLMGEVVLARTGDALAGGLRVVDITARSVQLKDAAGDVVSLELP